MSLNRLLNRWSTITYVAQSTTLDEYGNPTDEPSPATARARCYFEPLPATAGAGDESTIDRATTVDEWLYVVGPDVALTSIATVALDDEDDTFEMVGEPWKVRNPRRQRVEQVQARLRRSQR